MLQATIEAYGSSAGPFALPDSDIDICLMMDETGAEDLKFSQEVIDSLSPPKRGRTRPEGGRFAEKQWQEKQEKLQEKKEKSRLAWEEKVRPPLEQHRAQFAQQKAKQAAGGETASSEAASGDVEAPGSVCCVVMRCWRSSAADGPAFCSRC